MLRNNLQWLKQAFISEVQSTEYSEIFPFPLIVFLVRNRILAVRKVKMNAKITSF